MRFFSKKNKKQEAIFNIELVIQQDNYTNAEIEIADHLDEKCEYGDKMDRLTQEEKNFCFIENLLREVNNGGFNQWFYNSTGDNAHETLHALESIGALKMAHIVKDAISVWPIQNVPKDRQQRIAILETIEERHQSHWDFLDNKFYSGNQLDNYGELLITYVRKNLEKFR